MNVLKNKHKSKDNSKKGKITLWQYLRSMIVWVINPKKQYSNQIQAEKSRLLSIFILVLLLTYTGVDLLGPISPRSPFLYYLGYGLMIGAIFINRFVHYLIASRLTTFIVPFLIFSGVYSGSEIPITLFYFLVLGLIMGSFLIRKRGIIYLGSINSLGILLAPFTLTTSILNFESIINPLVFNLVATTLIVIKMAHNDQVKKTSQISNNQETQFSSIYANSPVGILIAGEGSILTDANRAACELLGYKRDQLIGKKIHDITHPDDHARSLEMFWKVVAAELPSFSMEVRFRKKTGEIIWVNLNSTLLFEDTGIPVYGIAIIEDITEKKTAQDALKVEKEKAQKYLDIAGVIFLALDKKGYVTLINQKGCEVLGYNQEEIIDRNWFDTFLTDQSRESITAVFDSIMEGTLPDVDKYENYKNQIITKAGSVRNISWHNTLLTHENEIIGSLSAGQDITDQLEIEEEIREQAETIQSIVDTSQDWIWEVDINAVYIFTNPAVEHILGISPDEIIGNNNFHLMHPEDREMVKEMLPKRVADNQGWQNLVIRWRHSDGSWRYLESSAEPSFDQNGQINGFKGVDRDITSRIIAERELRYSERKLKRSQKLAKLGYWVWYSTDNRFEMSDELNKILGINTSTGTITFDNLINLIHPEDTQKFLESLETSKNTGTTSLNYRFWNQEAKKYIHIQVETEREIAPDQNNLILYGTVQDITKIKHYEESLHQHVKDLKILQDVSAICLQNVDEDQIISRVTDLIGENSYPDHFGVMLLDTENILHIHPSYRGIAPEDYSYQLEIGKGIAGKAAESNQIIRIDDLSENKLYIPSTYAHQSELCVPIAVNDVVYGVINAESSSLAAFDSEDERLLKTVADQLALALQKSRLYQNEKQQRMEAEILQEISVAVTNSLDLDSVLNSALEKMQQFLMYDSAGIFLQVNGYMEIVALHGFHQPDRLLNLIVPEDHQLYQDIKQKKRFLIIEDVREDSRFEDFGVDVNIRGWMGVPLIDQGRVFGFVSFDSQEPGKFDEKKGRLAQTLVNQAAAAITKAKSFEDTQLGLKRLEALHEIDRIITSSVELSFSVKQITQIIRSQLQIDAASVLIYDKDSLTFRSLSQIGFMSNTEVHEDLPGRSFAFDIALERRILWINGEQQITGNYAFDRFIAQEGFRTYIGVPLIVKGEIKGVLELFHRADLETNRDWDDFLQTLATQLAIAIDNTQMFENLQKSNLELTLSYDATIEGWAKTLELRDQETQGHSERVTIMTVELARAMGMSEEELVHVRRGALLHDVGKIGIPDSILQKPEALNEEERAVMENHPTLAYNVLSGSDFLEKALDIPYCHHEKWDGTGYPRQLKGKQIPLPARIFAIIDVYDALRSDRPYREAWTKSKTVQYIKDQSGSHFDPKVVDTFLSLVDQDPDFNVY